MTALAVLLFDASGKVLGPMGARLAQNVSSKGAAFLPYFEYVGVGVGGVVLCCGSKCVCLWTDAAAFEFIYLMFCFAFFLPAVIQPLHTGKRCIT